MGHFPIKPKNRTNYPGRQLAGIRFVGKHDTKVPKIRHGQTKDFFSLRMPAISLNRKEGGKHLGLVRESGRIYPDILQKHGFLLEIRYL